MTTIQEEMYKGSPLLVIYDDDGKRVMGFGLSKATALVEHIETITAFVETHTKAEPPKSSMPPSHTIEQHIKVAVHLRLQADRLQAKIDKLLNSGVRDQNPTPRRQRQIAHQNQTIEEYQQEQALFRSMATEWEKGYPQSIPITYVNLRTQKEAAAIRRMVKAVREGYYHKPPANLADILDDDPAVVSEWWDVAVPSGLGDDLRDAQALATVRLRNQGNNGYFWTDNPVLDRVWQYLDLNEDTLLCDPSAGDGAIVRYAQARSIDAFGIELNPSLAALCHAVDCDNFLTCDLGEYRRPNAIVMNPPFGSLQELDHLYRAWEWLPSGGQLICILPPSPFFQQNAKSEAFRTWCEQVGAEDYDLPDGSFAKAGTTVATRYIVATKE